MGKVSGEGRQRRGRRTPPSAVWTLTLSAHLRVEAGGSHLLRGQEAMSPPCVSSWNSPPHRGQGWGSRKPISL